MLLIRFGAQKTKKFIEVYIFRVACLQSRNVRCGSFASVWLDHGEFHHANNVCKKCPLICRDHDTHDWRAEGAQLTGKPTKVRPS